MKEYIEREALMGKQWDCRIADIDGETYGDLRDIADFIAEFPAADVMEVVRCKDCKYKGCYIDGHNRFWCHAIEIYMSDDEGFFCSYGERRDDHA